MRRDGYLLILIQFPLSYQITAELPHLLTVSTTRSSSEQSQRMNCFTLQRWSLQKQAKRHCR